MTNTTADLQSLIETRRRLARELSNCDGGFPGSRAHARQAAAGLALQEFDDAHPEALEAIRAEHRARVLPRDGGVGCGGGL